MVVSSVANAMTKRFKELDVGDQVTAVAEITDIQYDTQHSPPKWILYTLNDSTASIRVFGNICLELEVGDPVQVELEVRVGREYRNKPQLAFKLFSIVKLSETDRKSYAANLKKLEYRILLQKKDLQSLDDGSRVKFFTQILSLHPPNSDRPKTQKVLVTDIEGTPISVWLRKTEFPIIEQIPEKEYFLLKALVKVVPEHQNARFLLFQSVMRGKDAYHDPAVRKFCEERIRRHAKAFHDDLELWKKFDLGGNEDLYTLNLMLSGLIKDFEASNASKNEARDQSPVEEESDG